MQVTVRDNNVDQALKALKKKMQREGIFREMKLRRSYEKPSERKAREKAEALAGDHPDTLIIGSDQVAVIGDQVLGKPGSREKAIEQLSAASGQRVTFLTGLCLLNTATGRTQVACDPFHVQFRTLRPEQIERYVDAEQPLNCAGSFKSEGLGIVLFKALEGRDPNTLVGLPLILLTEFLAAEGMSLPL